MMTPEQRERARAVIQGHIATKKNLADYYRRRSGVTKYVADEEATIDALRAVLALIDADEEAEKRHNYSGKNVRSYTLLDLTP